MVTSHSEDGSGRRRSIRVIRSDGSRNRFLRGMITHDLVKRGVDFDAAFDISREVRDAVGDREEVTTAELRELIVAQLEHRLGDDLTPEMREPWQPKHLITVISRGQEQPFSKGLLAESLYASGVPADRAYDIVATIEAQLLDEAHTIISSSELTRRADELLESEIGVEAKRRYRMVRRIERLPRPVVVYIGGSSGTGKSNLALQLAPLLRIYRVTATDTIRQVMRMVFTPEILPALHRSSFEFGRELDGSGPIFQSGKFDAELLEQGFREQARRVAVGVRAVVERAIAEKMSIIVEGVHLVPGLVPFADLEGEAFQIPILLASLDEEAHRTRLMTRTPAGDRRADRYLGAFESIRAINDLLLELAEANEVPLLDAFGDAEPELDAVQLVTAALERKVPALASGGWVVTRRGVPTLLLIIDGLADRPVRALGGRTALQAAATPYLDRLAKEGIVGLADAVAPGIVADTAAGTLALFGQSPRALKRGPVEALGAGLELQPGDIALRGNLATVDEAGMVVDRRAGRIREETPELAEFLDSMPVAEAQAAGVEILVRAGTEHRLAIVLRGAGLSAGVQGSDPGDGVLGSPPQVPHAIDDNNEAAAHTASMLAAFEREAAARLAEHPLNEIRAAASLPLANAVLTRGAGRIHRLISLDEAGLPLSIACISGDQTILGLAGWLGAEIESAPQMTANLDTDLRAKFDAAAAALGRHDLTVLHVKGADIAAHDRRPDLKVEFLERFDAELGRLLDGYEGDLRIAVGSDHATLSESGQHAADPLPVLIWGPDFEPDSVDLFDEQAAASGALGRFPLQMLLGRLYELG